jgi:ankyrin repeat protein
MEVVMKNLRKFVFKKCFLTLIAAAAISMSLVQDNFPAAASAGSGKVYPRGESHLALRRRALVVLFALNSRGNNSCADVNWRCLEFHLQPVCMPDGTIYRNPQGQSLFLSFNVEDLSAALGQLVQLPVYADQALNEASTEGQTGLVVFFLAVGDSVNLANEWGITPLHYASIGGHESVVQILLASGADVETINQFGWTPLHLAASRGHSQVIRVLLAAGATVDVDQSGWGPVDVTVNEWTPFGWTPLHRAAQRGREETCVLLIDAGADINFLDLNHRTPAMLARENGHQELATKFEMIEAIKNAGGQSMICIVCTNIFDKEFCVQVNTNEWKCSMCSNVSPRVVELGDEDVVAPAAPIINDVE